MIAEGNVLIQRVTPSRKQLEESLALIDRKLSTELKGIAAQNEKRASYLAQAAGPFLPTQDISTDRAMLAIKEVKQFKAGEYVQQRSRLADYIGDAEPQRLFRVHVGTGVHVAGPPYDLDWSSGVIGYAHKDTGEFGISPMNGEASAAVGVYLTTSQNTIGQITAYMPVTYSWFNWVTQGGWAGSNGGIGVMVYDLDDPGGNVLVEERAQIWNSTQHGVGMQNEPETMIYLSQTTAATTYFPFQAGRTYFAWVWCWGWTGFAGEASVSMSSIACKMPFMVVRPRHL